MSKWTDEDTKTHRELLEDIGYKFEYDPPEMALRDFISAVIIQSIEKFDELSSRLYILEKESKKNADWRHRCLEGQ